MADDKTYCVVCGGEITDDNLNEISLEHKDVFSEADCLGVEALTEAKQVLIGGRVHSDCYYELD